MTLYSDSTKGITFQNRTQSVLILPAVAANSEGAMGRTGEKRPHRPSFLRFLLSLPKMIVYTGATFASQMGPEEELTLDLRARVKCLSPGHGECSIQKVSQSTSSHGKGRNCPARTANDVSQQPPWTCLREVFLSNLL